jgi:hypothetical protein
VTGRRQHRAAIGTDPGDQRFVFVTSQRDLNMAVSRLPWYPVSVDPLG